MFLVSEKEGLNVFVSNPQPVDFASPMIHGGYHNHGGHNLDGVNIQYS